MPIAFAPMGKELKVLKILADEKIKNHLGSLGITIDSAITVLSTSGGSIICKVKDGRLALDRDLAAKILVA